MKCTLCESEARHRLSNGDRVFPFCDICYGGLCEPKSGVGRVFRRAGKHVIRRIAQRLNPDYMDTPTYKENARKALEIYKQKPENQVKQRARLAVRLAIRRGDLVRPDACQRCGDKPEKLPNGRNGQSQIWFHHTHGYEPPYQTVGEWLCKHCHYISEPSPNRGRKLGPRKPKESAA